VNKPQHGGVGGEKHQESAAEEEWTATDSVGERAHNGEPEEIRGADAKRDDEAVGAGKMQHGVAERGV